jgi:hypothetical protein
MFTGNRRPGIRKTGASSKYALNFSASIVALVDQGASSEPDMQAELRGSVVSAARSPFKSAGPHLEMRSLRSGLARAISLTSPNKMSVCNVRSCACRSERGIK